MRLARELLLLMVIILSTPLVLGVAILFAVPGLLLWFGGRLTGRLPSMKQGENAVEPAQSP
jgi:hypothetical protein